MVDLVYPHDVTLTRETLFFFFFHDAVLADEFRELVDANVKLFRSNAP